MVSLDGNVEGPKGELRWSAPGPMNIMLLFLILKMRLAVIMKPV